MKRKKLALFSIMLLSALFVGGAFASAADVVEVRLAGITMTSDTYQLGVAWSNMVKKYLPGVNLTVLAKGGTSKLLRGVANKQWEIGYIGSPHMECAKKGILIFKEEKDVSKKKYYDPTAVLFTITSGWCNYVTRADSDVKALADLKGKKVHLGNPGGFGGIMTKGVLRGHGLDIDKGDYQGMYLKTSQAMDQLRDNAGLDDALVWGGIPQPLISNLSVKVPLRMLGMTPKGFANFRRDFVVGPYTLTKTLSPKQLKEAYGGRVVNTEPVVCWSVPLMLVVRKDMDPALTYKLVKVFWDHLDEIKKTSKQLAGLDLKESLQNLSSPIHPGAMKYYKEIGVK
jgi:TRAP transporter TAXI family solute receptor